MAAKIMAKMAKCGVAIGGAINVISNGGEIISNVIRENCIIIEMAALYTAK